MARVMTKTITLRLPERFIKAADRIARHRPHRHLPPDISRDLHTVTRSAVFRLAIALGLDELDHTDPNS